MEAGFRAVKLKARRGGRGQKLDAAAAAASDDEGDHNDAFADEEDDEEREGRRGKDVEEEEDDAESKQPAVIPLPETGEEDKDLPMLLRNQPAAIRAIVDEKERLERHIQDLPESSEDQYQAMSIDDFGAAMLRGMGWTPSAASGKKGAAGPAPTIPRPALLGLGATPKKDIEAMLRERKRRKNGAERAENSAGSQAEAVKPQFRQGWIENGSLVRLPPASAASNSVGADQTTDADARRYAVVVQADNVPGLNNIMVQVDLPPGALEADRTIKVKRDTVELVDHTSLPDAHEGVDLRKRVMAELEAERAADESDGTSGASNGGADKKAAKRRRDGAEDGDGEGRRGPERKKKRHKEDSDKKKQKKEKKSKRKSDRREGDRDHGHACWLVPGIRVRIVSRSVQGEGLVGQKATVEAIEDTNRCLATLRVEGRTVPGVKQSQLSTALPKRGGRVVIVAGSSSVGARGQLEDRNNREALATVRIDGEDRSRSFDYDEVAELVHESY